MLAKFAAVGALALVVMVAVPVPSSAQELPPLMDTGGVIPADSSIQYEVLLSDPTKATDIAALDVADDGRVFFTEMTGAIKVLEIDGTVNTLVTLPTGGGTLAPCPNCAEPAVAEAGVHGIALAPDFATTGHLYVSWAVAHSRAGTGAPVADTALTDCFVPDNIAGGATRAGETGAGCYHLSRFTVAPDALGNPGIDLRSELVLLTWPFSRYPVGVDPFPAGSATHRADEPGIGPTRTSAHHGGGVDVLPDGSIVVVVGDNTLPEASGGYGPHDPRLEYWWQTAERTSLNPADRRGKVLRVNPDGSVPDDNPYGDRTGQSIFDDEPVPYDPYIYAMGFRNPYRSAVDPASGTLYVGQVGPDARVDDPARGPLGYDELSVLPFGQQFNGGYPRCIGPGLPYIEWDYENNVTTGEPFDCSGFDKPVLWYPHLGEPSQWPQLQVTEGRFGGTTITPGVVYTYDGDGALQLPAEYRDQFVLMDWSRGWAATIPLDEEAGDGSLDVAADRVEIMATGLMGPVDAAVGPDGAIYVAELAFYNGNAVMGSRIGRFVCTGCTGQPAGPTGVAGAGGAVPAGGLDLGVLGPGALSALGLVVTSWLRRRRQLI